MAQPGIHPQHVLDYSIRPALAALEKTFPGINSRSAERLLLGTAAHESQMGRWLVQRSKRDGRWVRGPATGIFQMEHRTYGDVRKWADGRIDAHGMEKTIDPGNLVAQAYAARLYYWPVPEALPAYRDIEGLARYWHAYWCRGCHGTQAQWINHYDTLVAGRIDD